MNQADLTVSILCGGRGRRLGGRNKAFVSWRDKPLVQHVCDALAPLSQRFLISANEDVQLLAEFGEVVPDEIQGYQGPVMGIASTLRRCTTPWMLVCAVDAPTIDADYVAPLLQCGADRGAYSFWHADQWQPLPSLVARESLPSVEAYLAAKRRSVNGWLDAVAACRVPLDTSPLPNINTVADLNKLPSSSS